MNTKTTFEGIESSERNWHLVDASGLPIGRLASEIAQILRGKHKPQYAPHLDVGDHVVVINASKISITSKKSEQKMYHSHSCLLYTSPSPRDIRRSRMPSSA